MFSKNCLDLDNTPVQRAPGIIWDPPKKDMLCIKGVTKNQTGGGGGGGRGKEVADMEFLMVSK